MSDSFFRKAIKEKIGEGTTAPGNDLWNKINTDLGEIRNERKKKKRFLILWFFPLLAIGLLSGFFYFYQNEIGTEKDFQPQVEKVIIEKNDEIAKANPKLVEEEVAESRTIASIAKPRKITNRKNVDANSLPSMTNVEKSNTIDINSSSNNSSQTSPFVVAAKEEVPLLQHLSFEPLFLKVEKVQPDIFRSETVFIEKIEKPTLGWSMGINYGINRLEYCFEEKATHEAAQLDLEYRFFKFLSAGIGLGFHNVNYDFVVDSSVHISAFGNTDKYPAFNKLKNDVGNIESRLSYFTLPVSLTYYQSIDNRLLINLTANQDFAYNQNQLLIYSFKSGAGDLETRQKETKIDLGLTTFRIGLDYRITDGLNAGLGLNRIISFKTLGLERQFYHGFGGNAKLRYDF